LVQLFGRLSAFVHVRTPNGVQMESVDLHGVHVHV